MIADKTDLQNYSGLIVLLGGGLSVLGAVLHPVGEDLDAVSSGNWVPGHLVFWVAMTLILLGLPGLYLGQAGEAGRLGLAGFVLAFTGTSLTAALLFMVGTVVPLVAEEAPALFEQAMTLPVFALAVLFLGYGLGYILFGIATMRAGVLPRWSGLLLVIGVVVSMLEGSPMDQTLLHTLLTVGRVLFGLALAWMGYARWANKAQPARADLKPGTADG